MNEFSLIDYYFKSFPVRHKEVMYGIGDDAACLHLPQGFDLLVSTDTLVSGVHFLLEWDPYDIACKAVMVNVSDMAAMAAEPRYVTLALTLPEIQQHWLERFSQGLRDSLDRFHIDLIGGDTTHGPLSITLTIMGLAPHKKSIRRSGAKSGDVILVSGLLGAAALAVKTLDDQNIPADEKAELMHQLLHPNPRVDLINLLRQYATSAIDISDGLSADLNHLCIASGVGACLNERDIPVHPLVGKYMKEQAVDLALTGGDDYELCFTVNSSQLEQLKHELNELNLECYPIGVIEELPGLRIKTSNNQLEELKPVGYSHF
ncbi:thiamine-phosphate kinase [Legionella bononiensis]|uniref:Thiamine-monophosphate kinase n=1 Tax=Legionella bononiensis TaxID=2793102 RepID=A0ABS1W7S2_9GAMM|nr:thiamine-phosphate kinase [Legionella bononiensis]MBL7480064.1 thiamine-phosphate kinase [Legionella bononiensis]MBL7525421.1 thiamine-phosphate kinase [Legionella bononiensis]MBL7561605.1 thiamine-phosphate kinase [Legionella bononiensis]